MRMRTSVILGVFLAGAAGPAWSQQVLPPGGSLSGGRAAGLALARQVGTGGLLLTGLGGLAAAGVALVMSGDPAGVRPEGQGQSAVINSTIGTGP